MICEICEAEEAAFTIIPVAEGMPQTLGPVCFARAGLEIAKAVLPAEEIASSLGPMFVAPARKEALGKASRSRSRRHAAKPTPTEAPAPTEQASDEAAQVAAAE